MRETLPASVRALREANPALHVLVRVNAGEELPDDDEAVVDAGPDSLLVPKVEEMLDAAGQGAARVELQLLVETPRGILNLPEIAAAGDRVVALMLGSLVNFGDLPALQRDAERARAFGCLGALCIHPTQVEVLNRAYSPKANSGAPRRSPIAVAWWTHRWPVVPCASSPARVAGSTPGDRQALDRVGVRLEGQYLAATATWSMNGSKSEAFTLAKALPPHNVLRASAKSPLR
ncbi:MAG: aldolase/citrate lyase family protein [Nocardioides sp.]|nr:aldolase/citrate lyase family protein [Nocardioides sp.]